MPSSAATRRILVVEPDGITRELLANVLAMAGCEAVAVDTGERALQRARTERGSFACLFTEIDLPGLVDGWIVADEFRATNPSSPIIFAREEPIAEAERDDSSTATVRRPAAPTDVLSTFKALVDRCEVETIGPGWSEPPRAVA